MVPPTIGGTFKVLVNRRTVLHDQRGRIHHIHQTTILEGGRVPDDHEMEQMALDVARVRGLRTDHLSALHIEAHELDPHKNYAVDPHARRLIELPARSR